MCSVVCLLCRLLCRALYLSGRGRQNLGFERIWHPYILVGGGQQRSVREDGEGGRGAWVANLLVDFHLYQSVQQSLLLFLYYMSVGIPGLILTLFHRLELPIVRWNDFVLEFEAINKQ